VQDAASPLSRNRDFAKLWIGEAASTFGSRLAYVAYPLLVLDVTGSSSRAGLIAFLRTLPYFVFGLPAGVVVDRLDRRRLMLVADVAGCAALGSVAVAVLLDELTFEQLVVVSFVDGCAALLFRTSEVGALPQIVAREQLSEAVATNQAREHAAFLAGPPVGGILYGVSRALPFLADAASYLVSACLIVTIGRPFQAPRARTERPRARRALAEGLLWLWREPFLRTSEFLVAGANFATNALGLAIILLARRDGASSGLIGAMLALTAVGGLGGALAAVRLQRIVSRRLIVVGYPWIGVGVLLALLSTPPPLVLGALFGLWVFFGPLWDAIVVGYRLSIVPDQLQGRVESVGTMIAFGGAALGPLAAGAAFGAFGPRATIALIGAWTLALALVGSLSRSLRLPQTDGQVV
jgi:MFS family permease